MRFFLTLTVLAFAGAGLAADGIDLNPERANVIADPEDAFMKLHQPEVDDLMAQEMSGEQLGWMLRNLAVVRVRADFNNDGILDEMLASSEEIGNGGGNFKLYLSDVRGGFHDMGSLVTSDSVRVVPVKAGSAKLFGCWHVSAERSNAYGYLIDGMEISIVPAEPLPAAWNESRRPVSRRPEYCGQYNTTYDVCRWKDWKRSGKCIWHTWQELEQLDRKSKD